MLDRPQLADFRLPPSRHQRLLLHGLDLLVQHVHLPAPVVAGAEPGEVDREDRVFPAAGQPGAVVDQAQGAQRLDEGQLAAVEGAELFVAVEQGAELVGALAPVAGQQHPQVLHRRAHAGVVQVDKMWAAAPPFVQWRPQDVAGVAVAVQAQQGGVF